MAGTPQSSASIPSFPKPWSDHDTVIVFLYTRSLCSYIAHCKMLMACDVLPIYSHTRWSCLVMNDKFNIVYRILIWINLYSYRYFPPRNDILLTKSGRGGNWRNLHWKLMFIDIEVVAGVLPNNLFLLTTQQPIPNASIWKKIFKLVIILIQYGFT